MTAVALPINGARVGLRRLRAGDLAAFQAYRADPALGRYQGWTAMADAAARDFLAEMAEAPLCTPGAWFQLGIVGRVGRVGDTLIGDIGLHLAADARSLEIGFTLASPQHGRGLAAEAVTLAIAAVFAHTPAQRVLGITDTRNTPSIRLLQRLGFRPLTTLSAVFRGEPCTEQHFVLHRAGRGPVRLRPAQPADAPAVAQVLIDTRAALMPYAPSAHDDDDVRGWVAGTLLAGTAGSEVTAVTLAEVDGAIAGVLATSHHEDGADWIEQLMVRPEQGGAGVGAALLAHALVTTARPLRLWTFQPNLHARAFYERHAFVAVKFTDGDNEEGVPDVMYELSATSSASSSASSTLT